MKRTVQVWSTLASALVLVAFLTPRSDWAADAKKSPLVRRGEYPVKVGSCNDCHTPQPAP